MNDLGTAIAANRKTGEETVIGSKQNKTMLHFWQWAYSDIVGNTERGCLAEFLVAIACGIDEKERISWGSYDLEMKNGIKIEVKSSAYLQSWKQKEFSKLYFGIQRTKTWDPIENVFVGELMRQADVYIFALLAHKEKKSLNPLDTNQWEFYILRTNIIDTEMNDRKRISFEKIKELNAIKSTFDKLLDNINRLFEGSSF